MASAAPFFYRLHGRSWHLQIFFFTHSPSRRRGGVPRRRRLGGAQRRRQERHLCWRDLKMLDDGFQHHVGGHDVQLSIIAMRYCYIDPRHHQIFLFFPTTHTDLKQHRGYP